VNRKKDEAELRLAREVVEAARRYNPYSDSIRAKWLQEAELTAAIAAYDAHVAKGDDNEG
jgi:hypothetical protein